MALSAEDARELVHDDLLRALRRERAYLDVIDRWWRWDHDAPHQPKESTEEYQELIRRSFTPWLGLVVTTVSQMMHVDGYRPPSEPENMTAWQHWQANRMDARQGAVHEAGVAYGQAFVTVLPGRSPLGEPMPVMRGVSPRRMIAAWDDPAADEWPLYALEMTPTRSGLLEGVPVLWRLRLYDDHQVHTLEVSGEGGAPLYTGAEVHGLGVCPVQRFANRIDLEGRTPGEVEPNISVAGRIDQTSFDRLIVQRFCSWIVRTISGMTLPDSENNAELEKLRLAAEDILVAEDPDTKFGSLPATPLSPFVEARDADIRDLAAVTQTPPHYLLGSVVNLSAEALAAAESALIRKVESRQKTFGESWESVLRLAARVDGDDAGWRDTSGQVLWRDMESRSLAQAADALGKLVNMGVPLEMVLEKVPGWTMQDVERAKELLASGESIDSVLSRMEQEMGAERERVQASAPQAEDAA